MTTPTLRLAGDDERFDDLLRAIKEQTEAQKKLAAVQSRLTDEIVRERAERKAAKRAGGKRAGAIRARSNATPRAVSPEAHAAAERFASRLGQR